MAGLYVPLPTLRRQPSRIAFARLGADAVCYSFFIVADFHRLLLAGFAGAPVCLHFAQAGIPDAPVELMKRAIDHFSEATKIADNLELEPVKDRALRFAVVARDQMRIDEVLSELRTLREALTDSLNGIHFCAYTKAGAKIVLSSQNDWEKVAAKFQVYRERRNCWRGLLGAWPHHCGSIPFHARCRNRTARSRS